MLKTPPLQTATATIDTLCGRLQSATLLEDRRAAILGLRSFAKQYPASVASGSLRELINTLKRDGLGEAGSTKDGKDGQRRQSQEGGDVDTIRLVLETLLMLFNPDSSSPEAGDEIAFFMADEFSMRQDNITLLLSLLDPTSPYADYYSRLYSVQLLSAICAARPERLQECILSAPLGVSRLVGVLDDGRDAVRNAGLILLVNLTSGANEDLRKIVAFEDVFGKVFALIRAEGGLAEAGITAQDCLSLLANLIRSSASNQTMFRESGCVNQMVQLLRQAFPPSDGAEAPYMVENRVKATWGLVQLLGFFLEPGEASTAQNQAAFFRAGTAQILIDLAFVESLPPAVRVSALRCAASLIASNAPLQEAFAALTVDLTSVSDGESTPARQVNGTRSGQTSARGSARVSAEKPRTYIIEALLDLALTKPQEEPNLRAAACALIQAYLTNHDRIKAHFLQRAIAGHAEHEEAANVVNTLLHPTTDTLSVLFASWIISDLVGDEPDAKAAIAAVVEGNESEGEDVLTFIQALAAQLALALASGDGRLVAPYASLLMVMLWEFATGVDSLLAEGSSLLQALVTASNPTSSEPVVAGLAAALLGTVYEFSTKDSPIPRRTLAPLLSQKLGRSKYLDALKALRLHPAVRDAELETSMEDALVGPVFVDLFMTEYSRLRKAIDKDPGLEVLPPSAAEAGVDRDVLDELRQQLQTVKEALSQAQSEAQGAAQQAEQDRLTTSKEVQTATAEADRLRRINQAIQQNNEAEFEKLKAQHEQQSQQLGSQHQRALESAREEERRQAQARFGEANRQAEARLREHGAASAQKVQEYERRLAELGNAHRNEQNAGKETARQLEALTARHAELGTREKDVRQQFDELSNRHEKVAREHDTLKSQHDQASSELERVRSESEKRQELVLRLTTQVKELREELKGREEELKTERDGFGELEKELESTKSELHKAEEAAGKNKGKPADSTANKEAEEKVKKLETEVKEAKEGEKSAKEELESMLLVMGDIETKRDEYKAKIKELGGQVTDDEDEDEDEDEEGDEEEGDGDEDVD